MHFGSPSDPSQTPATEAKPRYVYSILKPHGQSFRRQVRLLLSEATPSYVKSILKPVQKFWTVLAHIGCTREAGTHHCTSPVSIPSYCAHQHLNNYFRLHACLSFRPSVPTDVRPYVCHTSFFSNSCSCITKYH